MLKSEGKQAPSLGENDNSLTAVAYCSCCTTVVATTNTIVRDVLQHSIVISSSATAIGFTRRMVHISTKETRGQGMPCPLTTTARRQDVKRRGLTCSQAAC